MKAIVMRTAGSPEVLQLEEAPQPQLQNPTEILVRLKAAGVNPVDTKVRQRGTFYPEQMPAILGCDGAGIVEAVGSQVKRFQPGDEVYFCAGGLGKEKTGNYAEFAVIEEHLVAPKPNYFSFAEAAAAPLVLITAWEALYNRGRLAPGQTALIHAGAGGVGHVAIQLAKIRDAQVCSTVSTQDKARLVRKLGADYPILYRDTDFVAATLNWTDGEGVDLAFDTVGGKNFPATFPAVRIYGDIVTLLTPQLEPQDWKVARQRNLRLSLELMLTPALQGLVTAQQHQGEILRQCASWIDQGKLKIHLSQTYPLEEAAAAHRALESSSTTGKIALVI